MVNYRDICCGSYRCGTRVWRDLYHDDRVSNESLFERLKEFWAMTASVSGLIAGFSYLIVVEPPEFTNIEAKLSIETREQVYGYFTTF